MLGHDNLLTSSFGSLAAEPATLDGVRLHAAPMFHLADFALWVMCQLVPSTQVTIPAFDPVAVLTAIQEFGVTDALLIPR